MEDIKKIQEFFSKSLEENTFIEAFKLEKTLKGMGYDVKVKSIDDFGKNVFEIYFNNPEDADDDSIFYDVKKLGYDNFRVFANPQEHNTGIYYNPDAERNAPKAKDAAKSGMERVKDMLKKIMTEKKGHGEKVSKEFFSKLQGKTISYAGEDYIVVDSDDAVLRLQDEDGNYKTINFNQFNIDGLIREVMETIQLGKNLEEGKLCPKGEAYRKRRMAAGEKSSAYLSGRAVKVCKGQMSGKKKK